MAHSVSCPYCDWKSEECEFLGTAKLRLYKHLDQSPDCATQFEKDND